jgi:5-methylcytosine-specific restriction endonuclease McrA
MAGYRQIPTSIWKQGWFVDLPSNGKLLFLYLLSYKTSSTAVIRDLPIWIICFETSLEQSEVAHYLTVFSEMGKTYYQDGIIWIPEAPRYRNAPLSSQVRIQIMKRDGYRCRYCGQFAEHIDHVTPRCQGGSDDPQNLVASCAPCNLSKSGRTPKEAGMEFM